MAWGTLGLSIKARLMRTMRHAGWMTPVGHRPVDTSPLLR